MEKCISTNSHKAHFRCPDFFCDKALLAATVDACTSAVNAHDELLGKLWTSVFGNVVSDQHPAQYKALRSPTSSKHVRIVEKRSIPTKYDRMTNLAAEIRVLALQDIIRKELDSDTVVSDSKVIQWGALPDSVVARTRDIFTEIIRATKDIRSQQAIDKTVATEEGAVPYSHALENEKGPYSHIFNVVATLLCLHSMGIGEVTCSPLPLMTFPAESTPMTEIFTELLIGMTINPAITIHLDEGKWSALSPSVLTGLALVRVLTGAHLSRPSSIVPFVLERIGWGIGDMSFSPLSILVGPCEHNEKFHAFNSSDDGSGKRDQQANRIQKDDDLFFTDNVAHLETNLDDISAENLAYAIEILLRHGAIDAWTTPIVMKKGRPAHTLHCLCKDSYENGNDLAEKPLHSILKLMFLHTSTLGVRVRRNIQRAKLDRSFTVVATRFRNTSRNGLVDVKVASFKNGETVRKKAEYDHCREIAMEMGIPISTVADEAIKAYEQDSRTSEE